MTTKNINAGQWIFTESEVPAYFIYRLVGGKVSVHKSGRKVREVEVANGGKPVMLGIAALLRNDLMHMVSIRAETDIKVDQIYVDQVRGVLKNDIPPELRSSLSAMSSTVSLGNEIFGLLGQYSDLPKVDFDIPEGVGDDAGEVLSEIKRLYGLITKDVGKLTEAIK